MARASQRRVIVAFEVLTITDQHVAFQQQTFFQRTMIVGRKLTTRRQPQQEGLAASITIHE